MSEQDLGLSAMIRGFELGGCTIGVICDDKRMVLDVINALSTCQAHEGVHHFGVVREGKAVIMSPVGLACLVEQGVVLE